MTMWKAVLVKTIKAADGTVRAPDGTLLLSNDDIAARAGVSRGTINHYASARSRRTGRHSASSPAPMPAPVARLKMPQPRREGSPVLVWKRLWREDDIAAWIAKREAAK